MDEAICIERVSVWGCETPMDFGRRFHIGMPRRPDMDGTARIAGIRFWRALGSGRETLSDTNRPRGIPFRGVAYSRAADTRVKERPAVEPATLKRYIHFTK